MDWNGWITWTSGSLLATVHWLEAHPGTASWLEAVGSIAAIVFVYLFALFQGRRANSHQNTDRIRRAQGLALLLIPVLVAFKPKLEAAILHESKLRHPMKSCISWISFTFWGWPAAWCCKWSRRCRLTNEPNYQPSRTKAPDRHTTQWRGSAWTVRYATVRTPLAP
jgi:undecaprenyl pyrophosphate phosphatase UppP